MQGARVKWGYAAEASLRLMHWRQAERLDAAVQRFAETGAGRVERIPGAPTGARLRVPPYVLELELDPRARVIWVLGVSRFR